MRRRDLLTAGVLAATGAAALTRQAAAADGSLKTAVGNFNITAAADETGRTQPPLTEDEVIAAIRGWVRSRTAVSDEIYAIYKRIAETGQLPEGSEFESINGWKGFNGFDFDVWWINLSVTTAQGTGYSFRIRDQKLRSRPSLA